jgi:hypothetical protein
MVRDSGFPAIISVFWGQFSAYGHPIPSCVMGGFKVKLLSIPISPKLWEHSGEGSVQNGAKFRVIPCHHFCLLGQYSP